MENKYVILGYLGEFLEEANKIFNKSIKDISNQEIDDLINKYNKFFIIKTNEVKVKIEEKPIEKDLRIKSQKFSLTFDQINKIDITVLSKKKDSDMIGRLGEIGFHTLYPTLHWTNASNNTTNSIDFKNNITNISIDIKSSDREKPRLPIDENFMRSFTLGKAADVFILMEVKVNKTTQKVNFCLVGSASKEEINYRIDNCDMDFIPSGNGKPDCGYYSREWLNVDIKI